MKIIIGFISVVFILQIYGCSYKIQYSDNNETSYSGEETSSVVEEGILSNSVPEYSDVHDIGIPSKTGQSELIRITQEEFLTITQEELANYLSKRKKCEFHDWHAIVIDGNTAILCSYNSNEFIYGIWDEDLGITETLATHEDAPKFYTIISSDESKNVEMAN